MREIKERSSPGAALLGKRTSASLPVTASERVPRPSPRPPAEPVRVLMICSEYPPLGGGTAVACFYLLSEMRRNDGLQIDLMPSGTMPRLPYILSLRGSDAPGYKTSA